MNIIFNRFLYFPYQNQCTGSEPEHKCAVCPTDSPREFAGVRRAGFIKEEYLDTLMANPTDISLWQAGITAGAIVVFPETRGSYDPGDPKELKGYGDRKTTNGPRTMSVQMFDPVYFDNYHFYNTISNRSPEIPFIVTSSIIHIFDKAASLIAKDPIAEDIDEEVVWQLDMSIVSENLPSKHRITTLLPIFVCTAGSLIITTQPTGGSVASGGSKTFSVVASGGTAPYHYQWKKGGVDISGATSASYVKTGLASGDAGSYTVVVTDSASSPVSVTSSAAVLVVTSVSTLAISTQPTGGAVATGDAKTLAIAVTGGTTPYSYQWKKNGTNISGATSVSYIIASFGSGDAGSYTCVVTDAASGSVTSNAAVLTLASALAISTQPTNISQVEGQGAGFTVAATGGTTPYTYQWKKGGVNISGATSASYSKSPLVTGDAGSYTCVVTDSASASVTSNAAVLTVSAFVGDTILTFVSATTDTDQGVAGAVTATDADIKFEFNLVTPRTGTPVTMNINVSTVLQMVVDYPTDYNGLLFKFTDLAGATHMGSFTAGDVNF